MSCKNKVTIFIAHGFCQKEIKMPCGSTSTNGGVNLCTKCMEAAERRYPQGWAYVPGDICEHGKYVGSPGGPDYLCGKCEEGI